ncbi:hypothetical protein ACS0TY_030727 [Phlomoides rotata]
MCAAPGGKTTAMAILMKDDKGEVIAADRSHNKVHPLNLTATAQTAPQLSFSFRGTTPNSTLTKSKYFCPGDSFVSGAQVAKWQVLSDLLEENSLPLDQENDTQFMVRKSSEPSNDAVASQTGEGPKEITVGIAATLDGYGGDEASEMASTKFINYFLMHVVFTTYKQALSNNEESPKSLTVERMIGIKVL